MRELTYGCRILVFYLCNMRIFLSLLAVFIAQLLMAQCDPTLMISPTGSCLTAPTICRLDGYCTQTLGEVQNTVSFCGNSGLQGPSWIKFIATDNLISFDITVKSCTNNDGVQVALYTGCSDLQNGAIYCNTRGISPGTTVTVNATAVKGKLVYMVLDGRGGDVCSFEIHTNSGIDQPEITESPESGLSGPNKVCKLDGNQYVLENVGVAVNYIWEVSGNPIQVTNDSTLTINWPDPLPANSRICVRASNGCDTTQKYCLDITPGDQVTADAGADRFIPCNGAVSVGGNSSQGPNVTYSWTQLGSNTQLSDQPFFTTDLQGTYVISVMDTSGCVSTDSVTLQAPPPIVHLELEKLSMCFEDIILQVLSVEGGTAPYQYSVNSGSFSDETVLSGFSEQNIISIKDSFHCLYDTLFTLALPEAFTVTITPSAINVPEGSFVDIEGTSSLANNEISNQYWSRGSEEILCNDCNALNAFEVLDSGYIRYTVVDNLGCAISDSIYIRYDQADRSVFIPNAFTPNNDGVNDVFNVSGGNGIKSVQSIKIYNRWGACVYEGKNLEVNNQLQGWDGMMKGKLVENGVYVYLILIEMIDHSTQYFKGDISVVR